MSFGYEKSVNQQGKHKMQTETKKLEKITKISNTAQKLT